MAAQELPRRLAHKLGASDVVQETALEVQRDFAGFQGSSEAELFAWMRRILKNNIADVVRHYEGAAKRQVSRERPLDDHREGILQEGLPVQAQTPDELVMRRDDAALVAEALKTLSPEHRELLHLRYWEQCSFPEIAIRLNCSRDTARSLWYSAVKHFNAAIAAHRPPDTIDPSP